MILIACDNHPRRTRDLLTFTYTDADGIVYVAHYCCECAEEEAGDEFYEWRRVEGGFEFAQAAA